MPYAVYQAGYAIFGTGATEAAAITDAKRWVSDPDCLEDAIEAGDPRVHGTMNIAPCTIELVEAVEKKGGDIAWTELPDGTLSLPDN